MRQHVIAVLACLALISLANSSFAYAYRPTKLPAIPLLNEEGMRGVNCNTCHTFGGGTARNPFGLAWEALYRGGTDFGLSPEAAFAPVADLDSDGDGFTNFEELVMARTHPGYAESAPDAAFTRSLTAGLNTLSVPVQTQTTFDEEGLLNLLGSDAESVIRWSPEAGAFMPLTAATAGSLDGRTAYLAHMRQEKSVRFVGSAWNDSGIELNAGVNFVALPRDPGPMRLSDLLDGRGYAVSLTPEGFRAFHPRFAFDSTVNAPLLGGHGYIVVSPEPRTVDFGGVGWQD